MITASALRSNVYKLLDEVAEKGKPLTISRHHKILKITRAEEAGKLGRLVKHDCIKGDPEAIVHIDWEGDWKHDLP